MTNNDIFFGEKNLSDNDILNFDLAPLLGEENILLDIKPTEGAFIDPLSKELDFISVFNLKEQLDRETRQEETKRTVNYHFSFYSSQLTTAAIDPFTGMSMSSLTYQGKFGDFDGREDVTLEIKDADGKVVETFSLSGEGQGILYSDSEQKYVFFSGTDETTSVEISSLSNLKLDDYFGDSLKVETVGSITAKDIVLVNEDETGLVLRSGLGDGQNTRVEGYSVTNLGVLEALSSGLS